MDLLPLFTIIAIALTLGYAVLNGFRDSSTAVAAAVRTRALRPAVAVVVAAFFAFVGTMATTTLSTVLISRLNLQLPEGTVGMKLLIAALLAAGAWLILCWWRGIPVSSTHALMSALVGAGAANSWLGNDSLGGAVQLFTGSVLLPLLITPLIAYFASFLLVVPATWLMRHDTSRDVNARSRAGQAIAACAVALGLGLQDGQRTGATITLVLITGGLMDPGPVAVAIQLVAASALSFGVLLGGWRITYTLSRRLVNFDPLRGMVAQGVAATMLYVGSLVLHLPLSTTQAVTSSIVGAGANQPFESVVWYRVVKVFGHWLITPVVCILAAAVLALAMDPVG
ncbi:inorganic phosphate transporter [Glutamicibacter sp.]|uniref:inorganic phosphate transporter n=1 Tax=Glutamicibacter sp. TaxID=1931995 RepID=UPI002B4707DD|nr:inorganic phosphate transporter [Glutamicibacter sp.]HJX77402.1 inorganic phosphate transporter [Glutamicibacter sp.]